MSRSILQQNIARHTLAAGTPTTATLRRAAPELFAVVRHLVEFDSVDGDDGSFERFCAHCLAPLPRAKATSHPLHEWALVIVHEPTCPIVPAMAALAKALGRAS